jgi:UDP:flavonoid glycosyltransferase YjiC (YdhE family)
MTTEQREGDVLVLAGSGVGHFHPVAAFVARLVPPERVVYAAVLRDGHPVRSKVERDGSRLVERAPAPEHGLADRALTVARRTVVRRWTPRLARRGPADAALPGLASRCTFALASLLRPVEDARASDGEQLHRLLTELRPSLVLAESHDHWLRVLCAHHGVPWVRYTTGPVAELSSSRPTEPGGFDPGLRGAEGAASRALLLARRAREAIGARRVARAAARIGVSGDAAPVARIAFACASMDDHPTHPSSWTYAGLSPYRPPADWRDAPPATGRDSVLVTWGSGRVGGERELLDRLLPVLVELAATHRIVVQSADEALRSSVHEAVAPHGVVEVQAPDRDPQYDLYRRAALVIGHGGYGTINEAVAFGAPVLVLPELVADRMETARRVQQAGVGATLNRYTATTETLRAAVRRAMTATSVQQAVLRVGAELRDPSASERILRDLRALIDG